MTVCNSSLALSTYVQPDVWEIVEQGTKKHLSTLSPVADRSQIATSDEQIKNPRKITVASLSWGPIQMLKELEELYLLPHLR